jgi:glycerophosphoryl diester phosphodiesterase
MLIIGHRGAAAVAPENTIVSLQRAFADGADGVEFDVQLARDGAPVIVHDYTLRRTTGRAGRVGDFTAAELGALDAGSWFNRRHPARARDEYAAARIPTLDEVFAACPQGLLYLEMKCAPGAGRYLAAAVARAVREHEAAGRVLAESFAHDAIVELKRLAPEIRTVALFDFTPWRALRASARLVAEALACGASEIAPHTTLATRRLVAAARDAGLKTIVWTADRPSWVARARRLGLHAVITNHPARLVAERTRLGAV